MNSENIGFLQVAVKTADGALPVPEASVNIYEYLPSTQGQSGKLIYSLVTDENGNATKVGLEAKSKELSMIPGNDTPFTAYSVSVSKDGFYNSYHTNVPVFEGITSIQPVYLIPLLEYAQSDDDFPSSERRNTETPNTKL